jgi:peptidoglycan/LPS O-acetylase OafA/YrhL
LRGIAIALVVVHHLQKFAFQRQVLLLPAGFLGVDIFFVLSGFLITCLLLEEWDRSAHVSLGKFYARRALRLLPALLLFLLCVCAFAALTSPPNEANKTYWNALYSLSYTANWIGAFELAPISEPLGHIWSLAIEEQFYLIWPFLLLVLLKLKIPRAVILGGVVILIAVICLHRCQLVISGVWEHRIYSASDTRADSLLIGCLAAMLLSWRVLPTSRAFLRFLSVASFGGLLVIVAYLGNLVEIASDLTLRGFGFSLFGVAVSLLLIQFAINPPQLPGAVLGTKPLTWIGRISYGIYLWHLPICISVARVPIPNWMKAALVLILTVGAASASYYLVELPFLRFKKCFSSV